MNSAAMVTVAGLGVGLVLGWGRSGRHTLDLGPWSLVPDFLLRGQAGGRQ